MGPIWGQQDPGGPHVRPMYLAIGALFVMVSKQHHFDYTNTVTWQEHHDCWNQRGTQFKWGWALIGDYVYLGSPGAVHRHIRSDWDKRQHTNRYMGHLKWGWVLIGYYLYLGSPGAVHRHIKCDWRERQLVDRPSSHFFTFKHMNFDICCTVYCSSWCYYWELLSCVPF